MSGSCQPEAQHPELIVDSSHGEAIHVKSLMKDFRVDRSMMGRHAPESYRTTKRGQTSIPEKPPRGIGRFLLGRKTRPRRGLETTDCASEPSGREAPCDRGKMCSSCRHEGHSSRGIWPESPEIMNKAVIVLNWNL